MGVLSSCTLVTGAFFFCLLSALAYVGKMAGERVNAGTVLTSACKSVTPSSENMDCKRASSTLMFLANLCMSCASTIFTKLI